MVPVVPKLQHDPHTAWSLGGFTAPVYMYQIEHTCFATINIYSMTNAIFVKRSYVTVEITWPTSLEKDRIQ